MENSRGNNMNDYKSQKRQHFLPLSIQDKRHEIPSPLSLSPSAPGHRVVKTVAKPAAAK